MKNREKEIIIQLLRNSKLSDRQVSQKFNISQSTITRIRHKLEKKVINSYTIVPNLSSLGIKLIAFTLSNCTNPSDSTMKKINEFIEKQPNIVFVGHGEGMQKTGIFVSFHRDFTEYTNFVQKFRLACKGFGESVESFIVPTDNLLRTLNMANAIEYLISKE
jgi:DNA-binding Lrp family transcriptional regulator